MSIEPTSILTHSTLFSQGMNTSHLTPDDLVLYLQTRLDGVDDQINIVMEKQKRSESIRKAVQGIQAELAKLDPNKEGGGHVDIDKVAEHLNVLGNIDPEIARQLQKDLIGFNDDLSSKLGKDGTADFTVKGSSTTDAGQGTGKVNQDQIATMQGVVDNLLSDLESAAQMDMIKLQSLMSTRNTAISLATNMMSAIGKGQESIVGNIGR